MILNNVYEAMLERWNENPKKGCKGPFAELYAKLKNISNSFFLIIPSKLHCKKSLKHSQQQTVSILFSIEINFFSI